jgi:predicted DsbA family dithiol-disulfide isomerase
MEAIHIYSDVICPWCFVGKTRLDKALAQRKTEGKELPEIVWHPYELDPDTPPEGEDRKARLIAKYGADQLEMMDQRLTDLGRAEGIAFNNMEGVSRTPNTFQAHRLTAFAQKKGKGHETAGALFKAHFLEGKDIGQMKTLLEIGVSLGLPGMELEAYMNSDADAAQLKEEEEEAMLLGLRGVPYYLINRHPMYGAQEVETFVKALNAEAH